MLSKDRVYLEVSKFFAGVYAVRSQLYTLPKARFPCPFLLGCILSTDTLGQIDVLNREQTLCNVVVDCLCANRCVKQSVSCRPRADRIDGHVLLKELLL